MIKLVENPKTDLYAKIPHGTGQNILREALLIADHNAYHIGQIVLLRRKKFGTMVRIASTLSAPTMKNTARGWPESIT